MPEEIVAETTVFFLAEFLKAVLMLLGAWWVSEHLIDAGIRWWNRTQQLHAKDRADRLRFQAAVGLLERPR